MSRAAFHHPTSTGKHRRRAVNRGDTDSAPMHRAKDDADARRDRKRTRQQLRAIASYPSAEDWELSIATEGKVRR